MESPFAIGFYVISYFKLSSNTMINVLQLLENEAEDYPADSIPFDFISPLIHQIYTSQNVFIRCSTLRIISFFEINSPISIIEKYQFDKLVCMSIEQKPPDPPLKIDEEKVVSFRIVLLLIKMRHTIPISIVRSLISLFYTPNHTFNGLIVSYLCQAILLCDEFPDVPEVSQVLIDHLIETGDQNLIDFFGYIFEKQYIFMNYKNFTSKLLSSLSGAFNQIVRLDQASKIVIKLLGTWPGLFCFGVKYNAIKKLVLTLPHFQTTIIKIFTKLLFLNSPKMSTMNGYSGFLLYYLIKNNLINLLTDIESSNSETLTFIDHLLFFTSHYKKNKEITNDNINAFFNKGQILISNYISYNESFSTSMTQTPSVLPPLLKISQCIPSFSDSPFPNSPSTANSSLPNSNSNLNAVSIPSLSSSPNSSNSNQISLQTLSNSDKIEWRKIHLLLTVILPHNRQESQSQAARDLYSKIFKYFFARPLADFPKKDYIITNEVIFSLIELLLPTNCENENDVFYLDESKDFILAIINVLNLVVSTKESIDDHHPVWSIIETFCRLMVNPIGISIFKKQNMVALLSDIGKKFTATKSVERLLRMVQFDPEPSFSSYFYSLFVNSNSPELVKISLDELKLKSRTVQNFHKKCLEPILLKFVMQQKNKLAINVLIQIILENEDCLSIVAKDSSLHQIIKEHSRLMYCVMLRRPFEITAKTATFDSIADQEIEYWMKTGIYEYVRDFDRATAVTFQNDKNNRDDKLIVVDGYALVPPHLFGQLSQNCEGFKKLKNLVPTLLNILQKNDYDDDDKEIEEKRAALFALAHFGSVKGGATAETVNAMIQAAMTSGSCALAGTLIDCLSIMTTDAAVNEVIAKNGFTSFEFGDHKCVIPDQISLEKLDIFESESDFEKDGTESDLSPSDTSLVNLKIPSKIALQLPLLLNPIHQQYCTQFLFKASRGEVNSDEPVLTTQNAFYAHQLVAQCTFIPSARKYVFDLFRSTPIVEQRNDVIINQRMLAECLAKTDEATTASQMMLASYGFSTVPIPKFTASEIKNKKQNTPVPEVYLRDEEFPSVAGVPDRNSFYFLPPEQQNAIRNKLLM